MCGQTRTTIYRSGASLAQRGRVEGKGAVQMDEAWRKPADELPKIGEKVLAYFVQNVPQGIPGGFMLLWYYEGSKGGAPQWIDDCENDDESQPPDFWLRLTPPVSYA